MNGLLKGLLSGAAWWLLNHYKQCSLDLIKIRAAIWHVRGVKAARTMYVAVVRLALSTAMAGAGFILFHVGLFALLPEPIGAIVLLALGTVYMVAGLLIVRKLCSEKEWMKALGADKCLSLVEKQLPP